MSDAATFVVNLIDKVSGPAHDASRQLAALERQIKKTGRVGFSWKGEGPVPDVVKRLNRANLGTLVKGKIVKPLKQGAFNAIDSTTNALWTMGKVGVAALGAAGVAAAAFAVKGTVQMGMFAESTRLAFGLLTGDHALGEQVFTRTIELSKQLGMDVEETAHSMQKLLAMQMSPPDAEKWIKLGADLRSVGVDAGALQRVMLDIAHVKATGKLNTRNVNMFANAGVSAQLLMEEIGKAMGTDQKGAMEAMHHGKVTSDIALPALERAIMRKTHSSVAGQAGQSFADQTLTGLMGRLQNAPKLFFLRMADAAKGAIDKLKPFVDAVMKAIDGIQGGSFVAFIGRALDLATRLVPLALEFAKGFGEGFDAVLESMNAIDPAKDSLETARDLGKSLAHGFGLALDVLNKIITAIGWLDAHRNVAATAAAFLGTSKVLGGAENTFGAAKWLGKGAIGAGRWAKGGGIGRAAVKAASLGGTATGKLLNMGANLAQIVTPLFVSFGAQISAAITGITTAVTGVITSIGSTIATSLSALVAGLGGAAAAAAAGAAVLGIAAVVASWMWREQIAQWMLDTFAPRSDKADHRGLNASDMPNATPTPALAGIQRAAAAQKPAPNVTLHTTVNVDGAGKDGKDLGKDIGTHQQGVLEQFFQGHAIEQGAM